MKKTLAATLTLLSMVSVLSAADASAQSVSVSGNITFLRTGWSDDAFAIMTTGPLRNPAACPSPDGYISQRSLPGYDTFYSAALLAFKLNIPVDVVLDDTRCVAGRPLIIGIDLYR